MTKLTTADVMAQVAAMDFRFPDGSVFRSCPDATPTNQDRQEAIARELASLDAQRTRDIEELLEGPPFSRYEQLCKNLDTYHLLTMSKLGRLASLQGEA